MRKYQLYIDGAWCDPASNEWFESANPYTGDAWAQIPQGTPYDVDLAALAAHRAFCSGSWPEFTPSERGRVLREFANTLMDNAPDLAEIEVRDNGKLYAEVLAQCRRVADWFYYYSGLADKIEGTVPPIDRSHVLNLTKYEPLGVCACITPWNSPLLLLAWKVAPALAAGNTIVVKPSEYTSASSLEFARLSQEAGIPRGVINVVTGYGHDVGDALVRHPKVRKIAFTGGESAGTSVNLAAAVDFKRVTLELGGKSANIVFDDATLDQAVAGVISGIFGASGQTCIAGSRLLLHEAIHDRFLERLTHEAGLARMGNPMDRTTQIGPITTKAQFNKILEYIEIAKNEGAKCVLGGVRYTGPETARGLFIRPTIFSEVTPTMRIAREEVFGPVLAVIRFRTDDEALAIANDVNYGLAAGVWTKDLRRAIAMSERLEAGTVWVNTYRQTSVTTPFGGYKRSGLGRENGIEAVKEYLQVKSIWFSIDGAGAS